MAAAAATPAAGNWRVDPAAGGLAPGGDLWPVGLARPDVGPEVMSSSGTTTGPVRVRRPGQKKKKSGTDKKPRQKQVKF